MRTTIDLSDDLHELVRELAHNENRSMSEIISELIRLAARQTQQDVVDGSRGLRQVSIGRPITAEDVRSLEDDG